MAAKDARTKKRSDLPSFDWDPFLKFLREIGDAQHELDFRRGEECFFRGHPKREYRLLPSLFRTPRNEEEYLELESDLFFEFKARGHEIHDKPLSDWDIFFYMRHHGAPTRLLDWTETFGVALYFALHNQDGRPAAESPCIHLLNPYALNEKSHLGERELQDPRYIWYGEDDLEFWDYGDIILDQIGMDWWLPVAIYPEQRANRVRAQRGWFTLHGDDLRPIDEQVKGVTAKVELPLNALPAAYAFLEYAGLDQFALFPELDGLTSTLIQKSGRAYPPDPGAKVPRRPGKRR